MPQSSAALRQKAAALRLLRQPYARPGNSPTQGPSKPVWARKPLACAHGICLAIQVRQETLWVLVRDATGQEAWAQVGRILTADAQKSWARAGFG